jgi:hypothetical protein
LLLASSLIISMLEHTNHLPSCIKFQSTALPYQQALYELPVIHSTQRTTQGLTSSWPFPGQRGRFPGDHRSHPPTGQARSCTDVPRCALFASASLVAALPINDWLRTLEYLLLSLAEVC